MTVDEFLAWDSGDQRRYDLVDGVSVAMNPPASAHRAVAMKLGWQITEALRRWPP